MNKYEEKMTQLVKDFSDGIWFKNDNVKVGYSFAEVFIDDTDENDFSINIESEEQDLLSSDLFDSWEDVFKQTPNLEFVISRDCAERGNFITWQQFKDALDDKGKVDIVSF